MQGTGRTGGNILHRAAAVMPGRGAAGIRADISAGKIGRVAGGEVIFPLFRAAFAERPQVGAKSGNMLCTRRFLHSTAAQGRSIGIQLHRCAWAAVPGIVPGQRYDSTPAAQVQRCFFAARHGKPGQQQGVRTKGCPRPGKHLGAVIQ